MDENGDQENKKSTDKDKTKPQQLESVELSTEIIANTSVETKENEDKYLSQARSSNYFIDLEGSHTGTTETDTLQLCDDEEDKKLFESICDYDTLSKEGVSITELAQVLRRKKPAANVNDIEQGQSHLFLDKSTSFIIHNNQNDIVKEVWNTRKETRRHTDSLENIVIDEANELNQVQKNNAKVINSVLAQLNATEPKSVATGVKHTKKLQLHSFCSDTYVALSFKKDKESKKLMYSKSCPSLFMDLVRPTGHKDVVNVTNPGNCYNTSSKQIHHIKVEYYESDEKPTITKNACRKQSESTQNFSISNDVRNSLQNTLFQIRHNQHCRINSTNYFPANTSIKKFIPARDPKAVKRCKSWPITTKNVSTTTDDLFNVRGNFNSTKQLRKNIIKNESAKVSNLSTKDNAKVHVPQNRNIANTLPEERSNESIITVKSFANKNTRAVIRDPDQRSYLYEQDKNLGQLANESIMPNTYPNFQNQENSVAIPQSHLPAPDTVSTAAIFNSGENYVVSATNEDTMTQIQVSPNYVMEPFEFKTPKQHIMPRPYEYHTINIEGIPTPPSSMLHRTSIFHRFWRIVQDFFSSVFLCLSVNRDCIFCLGFFVVFIISASFLTAFFYRTLNLGGTHTPLEEAKVVLLDEDKVLNS